MAQAHTYPHAHTHAQNCLLFCFCTTLYLAIPFCTHTSLNLWYMQFFALVSVRAISLSASLLFPLTFLYSCSRLLPCHLFLHSTLYLCFQFSFFFSLFFLLFVLVWLSAPSSCWKRFFFQLCNVCSVCAWSALCLVACCQCACLFQVCFFSPPCLACAFLLNLLRLLWCQLAICFSFFIAFLHIYRLARMFPAFILLTTRMFACLFVLAYGNLFTCRTSVPLFCWLILFILSTT